MRPKLEQIMELPPHSHPFFLLPRKTISIPSLGAMPGLELGYRELGQGQPILCLHGLWSCGYTFRTLVEPLAKHHRVIIPDLLDPNGQYPKLAKELRPENQATLFFRLIEALKLEQPLVVGHGESGLGAILLGLDQSDKLKGLITVGTSAVLPASERIKGLIWGLGWSNRKLAKQCFAKPSQTAWRILDYTDPTLYSRQEIRQLAQPWTTWPSAQQHALFLMKSLQKNFRQIFRQRLEEFSSLARPYPVPLKLLYGGLDQFAKPSQGEKLNRWCVGSELLVEENSGTQVQIENTAWTLNQIQSML